MTPVIDRPLRILLVEDCALDAALIIDQLMDAGMDARFDRVDTALQLALALQSFKPDIVLSDLTMPGFSGYEALEQVRASLPELPFIFVSGTMGEDAAVAALRRGANDYIIKQQPARLPAAVQRAVAEARAAREQRHVEAELMRAQRLESLSLLAAGLSHDLRNILQPLLIMPALLKARTTDSKLHHLADVIAECGRRGHEMAESMLSFVRGSPTSSEPVQIGPLFQAVELLLRSSLPVGIRLQLKVDGPLAAVQGNFTELQQVLLNLALNGIQAMPEGGRLMLEATVNGGDNSVAIRVQDEGTGMDEATLQRLFSPFFTTKPDGTGLGLMSCRRIVEHCGGRITVESTPGKGSCFTVWLRRAAESLSTISPAPSPPRGKGQRVLVVDGEAPGLRLLGNALTSQGYDVQRVADGAAALRLMQGEAMPALVIMDGDDRMLPPGHLLQEMMALGYRGSVLVLDDESVHGLPARPPTGLSVHGLRKPLRMQDALLAVARALPA